MGHHCQFRDRRTLSLGHHCQFRDRTKGTLWVTTVNLGTEPKALSLGHHCQFRDRTKGTLWVTTVNLGTEPKALSLGHHCQFRDRTKGTLWVTTVNLGTEPNAFSVTLTTVPLRERTKSTLCDTRISNSAASFRLVTIATLTLLRGSATSSNFNNGKPHTFILNRFPVFQVYCKFATVQQLFIVKMFCWVL